MSGDLGYCFGILYASVMLLKPIQFHRCGIKDHLDNMSLEQVFKVWCSRCVKISAVTVPVAVAAAVARICAAGSLVIHVTSLQG